MGQVQALTRAEVISIGWSGDAQLYDIGAGVTYNIRGSAPVNYDHTDYQTKTTADTATKKSAAGGSWNWTPRPTILKLSGGQLVATATHSYPHSIPVASGCDNIVSPARTRANEKDASGNWVLGSHFCLHYIDSIDGRSGKRGDGSWTDKMYQAVVQAAQSSGASIPAPSTGGGASSGGSSYVNLGKTASEFVTQATFTVNGSSVKIDIVDVNGEKFIDVNQLSSIIDIGRSASGGLTLDNKTHYSIKRLDVNGASREYKAITVSSKELVLVEQLSQDSVLLLKRVGDQIDIYTN